MKNHLPDRIIRSDVVVVGSGIAGMSAAIGVKPLSVTLVTKCGLGLGSSSQLAQGGVAVALGDHDSPRLHAHDTLTVGCGLSDREAVAALTREGPSLVRRLIEWGAAFDTDAEGVLHFGREAAHSRRRIVHANGDATGAAIVKTMAEVVHSAPRITIAENCQAIDLLVRSGEIIGVAAREQDGSMTAYLGGAVVLATGGIGALYRRSTNPAESTGDGIAMAARAGAELVDLEFVQFHPTALAVDINPVPLLTEALRGEGAWLVLENGTRFMTDEHPDAELAPRDVVARAIWRRLQSGESVYLDDRRAVGNAFPQRFPTVFRACSDYGLDPRHERLPVTPAAHYHIGGVAVDLNGRASLAGLWACGETAATGVHGANRLASNSLLEALVFGNRVAEDVKAAWRPRLIRETGLPPMPEVSRQNRRERLLLREKIQHIMWDRLGLIRDEQGIRSAIREFSTIERSSQPELRNMLTVGRLIAMAALSRKESRGVHFRSDFPETNTSWQHHVRLSDPGLPLPAAVAEAQ